MSHGPLSPRQTQVAELLAAGLSRRQVARELGISEHTVKMHIKRLYERLPGEGNVRVRAVRWAMGSPSVASGRQTQTLDNRDGVGERLQTTTREREV